MGAGVGCHCQVRLSARLDFKVVLAHPGTQSSLWETPGILIPALGLISLCKGQSVWKLDYCDEGGGWGKKEAGLGAALALLVNFKLPLPGKVTPTRPSAVLACFAFPPLGMGIISRGL